MEGITKTSKSTGFYEQLFKKVLFTTSVVAVLSLSYVLWVNENPDSLFLPILVVGLAFVKTIFIVRLTFLQLSKIIGESHQLTHVLTLFAVLIILIILSFSADYLALYGLNSENFKSATSMFPCSSHSTKIISIPASAALAGFVPCADDGIRTKFL